MAKGLVTANSHSTFFCDIDLRSKEWSSLLPENISPFKMEEKRQQCSAYPEGLFPSAIPSGTDKQISRIQRFPNYIEFSKIMADELVPISGQLYLTTKFYDRRKEGWSSNDLMKKEGEIMAYCINGDVYCAADKKEVYKVFYDIVYTSLISKDEAFLKLIKMLKDGIGLTLIGADEEFMLYLKDALLTTVKK